MILHIIVSSIVLALAIAVSYLPQLTARTRFAVICVGLAKLLVPASLFAPFMAQSRAAVVIQETVTRALPVTVPIRNARSTSSIEWIVAAVGAISLLLIVAALISSARTVTAALRLSVPATSRDVSILNIARKRIGVAHAVDIVRSPISEAPAVVRVLRPLIVLPAEGPDALDDDELESLLCHECAHVRRRDNLLALFESLVRSAFWFNPLVWLAHRRLAEEREKACDEIVADTKPRAETYAQALVKICEAILARPAAGVSCMASAHLKQRMEHIMRYQKSARMKFVHAAVISAAVMGLFGSVAATAAINKSKNSDESPYAVTARVGKIGNNEYVVQINANEQPANRVAWASRPLRVKGGEKFTARSAASVGSEEEIEFRCDGLVDETGTLSGSVDVTRGGNLVQHIALAATPTDAGRYTGTPISMNLKSADIRDVLRTFAKLTGLEIIPSDDVKGLVDVNVNNVPWDKALDDILKEHGYTWRVEGNRMTVYK